ncbi:MAG: tRNA 2-thiouridine(34) synthase MnmA [Trueperaceae bacterium]|nr:tRNA 2-thiouridine(34) synthase MnmA [Trueperaceae bacterium]
MTSPPSDAPLAGAVPDPLPAADAAPPERGTGDAPRVFVAMSGGVDSSVAAATLVEQGFEVVGSMLRFWPDDREAGAFDTCCSPAAAYDARRIADALDVPFYLLDARELFDDVVVDPFVPAYEAGETPNPCVWCNREIKFGRFARQAQAAGAEFMATGHFVRRVDGPDGPELHRGLDDDKDQTYFLWALPRAILPYLLFPLGERTKAEVRALAAERGYATAYKKSSSGLCFVADSVQEHLRARSAATPGPVVDASCGREVVGRHDGVAFYTVGQKRGLGLFKSHEPRFVLDLEPETNTVVVGPRAMCAWSRLRADAVNLLLDPEALPERVQAQVRYRTTPVPARVTFDGTHLDVRFDAPQFAVTVGQSVVLYDGDRLLGGGVIRERHEPAG